MERRKFRADLKEEHVKKLFIRQRRPKPKIKQIDEPGSQTRTVTAIPSEMLVKAKVTIRQRNAEYAKPEHWIFPEPAAKVSRTDNLRSERDNILKKLNEQMGWSRAARLLGEAMKKPEPKPRVDLEELEDR